MNKKEYQQFQKSIRQCQERSQKTLASIDSTLLGVRQTLKDIKQTNDNIDKIKEEYNNVMDKLSLKIANSFMNSQQPFKKHQGVKYQNLRQQISEQQVAKKINKQEKILIITGAGVSVDSGIPTFRGKSGLYTNGFSYKGKSYTPEEFISLRNYKQNPEGVWEWIDDIYNLASKALPNQTHKQIDILAKQLSKKGKQVVLATQNIDDLHIRPQKQQYKYYNIHGNCKFLRCEQHHFSLYSQTRKDRKCKICGKDLRPHILFFDESYGMNYGGQIKNQQFPLVICIGSSVKTGLAINMLQQAEQIIQINPEPVLEVGKVYCFTKKASEVLERINYSLQNIKNQ